MLHLRGRQHCFSCPCPCAPPRPYPSRHPLTPRPHPQPDPGSRRRHRLPGKPDGRFRHTMVLFQGALYIYGGDTQDKNSSTASEPPPPPLRPLPLLVPLLPPVLPNVGSGPKASSAPVSDSAGVCCLCIQAVLSEGASLQVQLKTKPSQCGALTSR